MRGLLLAGGVIALLLWLVIGGVSCGIVWYRDDVTIPSAIDRWCDRAQVAADIEDMADYLQRCEDGLDRYDMRDGHAGLIVKNAGNDMALIRHNLDRLQERAEGLKTIPPAERQQSTTYQVGLDDLRGTIREFQYHTEAYYWRHDGLLLMAFAVTALSIGWIPGALLVLLGLVYEDRDRQWQ